MNNDLRIKAAFSKMKNNLRFMAKSVQKDPELLVTKVKKIPGDSSIYSGGRKAREGRSLGEKRRQRAEGGAGIGWRKTR